MSKVFPILVVIGAVVLLLRMGVDGGDIGGVIGDVASFFLDALGGAADSTETVG